MAKKTPPIKREALADGLSEDVIDCSRHPELKTIGASVQCRELIIDNTAVASIPDDINVEFRLSARDCQRLTRLPAALRVHVLNLQNCVALENLPERLSTAFLNVAGCSALKALPEGLEMRGGSLILRDCPLIEHIPAGAGDMAALDVSGCRRINSVPPSVKVFSWIDVAGSGLTELPPHLAGVGVRWRGVSINERIAFRPETLVIDEILAERNAEVRRVMVERFGFDRFMTEAKAEVLDKDRDAGGERQLLRVPIQDDEDIVCVSVFCPSTGGQFFLRVPPSVTTCRNAIAWTAGYDNPADYHPLIET
jgi:hypothetical protein